MAKPRVAGYTVGGSQTATFFRSALVGTFIWDFASLESIVNSLVGRPWSAFCLSRNLPKLHADAVRFAVECITTTYGQEAGVSVQIKAEKDDSASVTCDRELGVWQRFRLNQRIRNEVRLFQSSRLPSTDDPSSMHNFMITANFFDTILSESKRRPAASDIAALVEVVDQFGLRNVIFDWRFKEILEIEASRRDHSHFKIEEYDRMLRVVEQFGPGNYRLIHFLICQGKRSRAITEIWNRLDWHRRLKIETSRSLNRRFSETYYYTIDQLETLAQFMSTSRLDKKFVVDCLGDACVVVPIEDLLTLQKLTTGENGITMDVFQIARLFFRGVLIEQIGTVHELMRNCGLSFKRADKLGKLGVIPELATALEKLPEDPDDKQIIRLHELILYDDWGFEYVIRILHEFGDVDKTLTFFILKRVGPKDLDDNSIKAAVDSTTSFGKASEVLFGVRKEKPRAKGPSSSSRRQNGKRRVKSETAPVNNDEPTPVVEPIVYRDVSVSLLPNINGRKWLSRFQKCGWNIDKARGSSHMKLTKGSLTMTFIVSSNRSTIVRYEVWDWLRRGRIPEVEIKLLIAG